MNTKIDSWLKGCDQSNDTVFEIHVDQVSSNLKSPGKWVSGTLQILLETESLLRQQPTDATVAAAFALESTEQFRGVNFLDVLGLQNEFGLTPPSVYYFKHVTPWQLQEGDFHPVTVAGLLPQNASWQSLYCEYQEPGEFEFRRSLWIVPKPSIARDLTRE